MVQLHGALLNQFAVLILMLESFAEKGLHFFKELLLLDMADKLGPPWQRAYLKYQAKYHGLVKRRSIYAAYCFAPTKKVFLKMVCKTKSHSQIYLLRQQIFF